MKFISPSNGNKRDIKLKAKRELTVIGRREEIDFPDLGLKGINAKIDTGAYTSSLHCYDIREENNVLYFKLLDPSHENFKVNDQQFTEYTQKNIKSSFGEIEKRYVIKAKIMLGDRTITSDFSLTNRGMMKYPVLIGRRVLNKRFLVDVSKVNNLMTTDEEG